MTKRSLELTGTGIPPLELSKATAIKVDKQMIHIDQLPDGTWRLIYSTSLIPDITQLKAITIIREDGDTTVQSSNPR